jgi:hypothetical protein
VIGKCFLQIQTQVAVHSQAVQSQAKLAAQIIFWELIMLAQTSIYK